MKLIHSAIGAVSVIGVLGACASENAVSTTTTTSAVTIMNATAVENVAYARCMQENSCNNVGEGRKFESLAACTTQERAAATATIGPEMCPNGVDAYALQTCVSAIDRSSCPATNAPSECSKRYLCF